ncbi:hypothetical protein C1637_02365 [Chryseobacterium lactis]|uniref:T9SS C-terminal target domain-containing protein n=1 Tax=Chryseobacterium lactis TaxID=1241981 RepID=A0A3G6RNF2_CHRLC|nr:T9SS type A sorting domain-containing protein [Chryseobacterium lactis]AZA81436.1 T9SS C-terminal target domain-containing protein [Chryseobacterium lactis]AZB06435.1 T9SS C-terminal target domain-containing protein [Chryseobacterium lactis]PNW15287.1 hypothetical protein C1637_02365 [Chryseobacterium lactis]
MKKALLSGLVLLGLYANAQVNVTASSGTATATYTTLKGAFDAINTGVHQGNINLSITANTTETATAALNAVTTYSSIIIKPTVTATIGGAVASAPLVNIQGSNVTIDGSSTVGGTTKDLTISNTAATGSSVIYMGSAASAAPLTNVTIKNSILLNGTTGSTNLIIANGSTVAGYFNNITVQNNDIRTGFNGIFVLANTAAGNGNNLLITGNTVTNNIIQNAIYVAGVGGTSTISNNTIAISRPDAGSSTTPAGSLGINLGAGTNNATINGNTISAKNTSGSGINYVSGIAISPGTTNVSTNVYNNTITEISGALTYVNSSGVYVGGVTPNVKVYSNKMSGLKNTLTGNLMQAIVLGSSSTTANTLVYNNVISDVLATGAGQAAGIFVYSGAGYKIYNNTVNLNTSNSETGISAAFYVNSTNVTAAGALDVRNNILANNKTGGSRYSIYTSGASNTIFGNINYNDYFTTGTALGFIGSDKTALTDIQTGYGGNVNSLNIAPVFVSATDLHLDPSSNSGLDNKGTSLPEVTTDFSGTLRGAVPDMGAYEFTSTALGVSDVNAKAKEQISVYPNPFSEVIKISDVKGIKAIQINDLSGKSVKTLAPASEINLSDLTTGLYMITFQLENGTTKTLKIIKK